MKKLISLSICLFLILLVKLNYASSIDPSSIDMNDPNTLQMIFQLGLGKVDELKGNLIKNQKTQDDATKVPQIRMMLGLYDEIRKQSRLMNPDPASLEALQKLQQTVDKLGTDMWTDPALFAVVDNIDVSKLDNNAIRLINKAKRKFIRYEFKPASGKTIALHKVSDSRVLEVLQCPDARLRTVAETVTVFDDKLQALIDDMFETMYEKDGIGLAATQINQHVRVVVMDISSNQNEPMVFINPKITALDDTTRPFIQGCLSVQGAYDSVTRPARVRIDALDRKGNPFSMEDSELIAVCIQHEIDHLNGKLFIDHLSEEKRKQIIARLENQTEN